MPFITGAVSNDGQVREQIVSMMDLKEPDVRTKMMLIYGKQGIPFSEQIRSMGYERMVSRYSTKTYEDTDNRQTMTIASVSQYPTSGNGYTMILAVSAAAGTPAASWIPFTVYQSIFAYNQSAPYVAGQYAIPLQLNDFVMFPENNAWGQVYNISGLGTNAVTLTLKFPRGAAGQTITASSIPAGYTVPYVGNSWSENSGQPNSRFYAMGEDTHYLSMIKGTVSISGDQMTDQIYAKETSSGAKLGTFEPWGNMKADWQQIWDISQAMLFSPGGGYTTYLDPTTNKEPNQITEGLVPYAARRGTNFTYAPGTLSLQMIELEGQAMLQNYAYGDRIIYDGFNFDNELNDCLRQVNANSGVKWTTDVQDYTVDKYFGKNRNLAMNINWATFSLNSKFKYFISSLPELDFVDKYNQKHKGTAIIAPLGMNSNAQSGDSGDSQGSLPLPFIGMIYKGHGTYSRMNELWNMKAAGGDTANYNQTLDAKNTYYRAHVGGEHTGGNQMSLFQTS